MHGIVTWWSQEKGFGFIHADDGRDAFLHYSEFRGPGYGLLEGDRLEFEVIEATKGPRAVNAWKVEE
ncbi:MAG: cold shock domain-containing protein [Deltaproteobacteria bacterium]|nr:cold shock domain-containing protein [Deltaproteobacteria bacterium]